MNRYVCIVRKHWLPSVGAMDIEHHNHKLTTDRLNFPDQIHCIKSMIYLSIQA